jgi:hypothetical protein
MVHELTSDKTADAIEAGGTEMDAVRRPGSRVLAGDGCVVRSSDGCTFIGDVLDAGLRSLSVRVRLG